MSSFVKASLPQTGERPSRGHRAAVSPCGVHPSLLRLTGEGKERRTAEATGSQAPSPAAVGSLAPTPGPSALPLLPSLYPGLGFQRRPSGLFTPLCPEETPRPSERAGAHDGVHTAGLPAQRGPLGFVCLVPLPSAPHVAPLAWGRLRLHLSILRSRTEGGTPCPQPLRPCGSRWWTPLHAPRVAVVHLCAAWFW